VDLTPALKEGERSSGSSGNAGRKWLSIGNALVVAQVALAIVVLVGAGLLVRTLQNLRSIDVGFDSHNILVFGIDPTLIGYKGAQVDTSIATCRSRLAANAGSEVGKLSTCAPLYPISVGSIPKTKILCESNPTSMLRKFWQRAH